MNVSDCAGSDTGVFFNLSVFLGDHCRRRLEFLIILFKEPRVDVRKFFLSDQRQNVIPDQRIAAGISGKCPLIFPVQFYILTQKILETRTLRHDEGPLVLFELDRLFPPVRLSTGFICLPFLSAFSICIHVMVNDAEFSVPLPDRRHASPLLSFLFRQPVLKLLTPDSYRSSCL